MDVEAAAAVAPERDKPVRCHIVAGQPFEAVVHRNRKFADSPLEEDGFEPSVPLLRKALLGVANRSRRHESRSYLQVQVRNGNACLEWLTTAFPFAEGPRVRIRLPPAASQRRTPFGPKPAASGRLRGAAKKRLRQFEASRSPSLTNGLHRSHKVLTRQPPVFG
jgi:hypothetical protein